MGRFMRNEQTSPDEGSGGFCPIIYLSTARHSYTMERFKDGYGKAVAHLIGQIHTDRILEHESLPTAAYIFSDLERLRPAQLRILGHIWEILEAADAGIRLLNHPQKVLRRFELLETLHTEGINKFRAYTIDRLPEPIEHPLFLRLRREHNGSLTQPTTDRDTLNDSIATLLMHGVQPHDLIAIEFCDTRSPDGYFRKYGAHRVGSTIVPRHLMISPEWEVNSNSRFAEGWAFEEEFEFVHSDEHAAHLMRAFNLAQIDYGRIDYGIADGEIQVWEINTNPIIAYTPEKTPEGRKPTQYYVLGQIAQALAELAESVHPGPPVPVGELSKPLKDIIRDM